MNDQKRKEEEEEEEEEVGDGEGGNERLSLSEVSLTWQPKGS